MIFALALAAMGPQIVRNRDAITDKEVVMAIWMTDDGDALSLACAPASRDIRIAVDVKRHDFGHTGLLTSAWPVTYRFDQKPPRTADWFHDQRIAQSFSSEEVANFINGALTAKQIVFRARDNFGRGDSFDLTFQLGDAKAVVNEVIFRCESSKAVRKFRNMAK